MHVQCMYSAEYSEVFRFVFIEVLFLWNHLYTAQYSPVHNSTGLYGTVQVYKVHYMSK